MSPVDFPPLVPPVARREALLRTFVSVSAGSAEEGEGTEAGQCVSGALATQSQATKG